MMTSRRELASFGSRLKVANAVRGHGTIAFRTRNVVSGNPTSLLS
jgi:hypothetical protein